MQSSLFDESAKVNQKTAYLVINRLDSLQASNKYIFDYFFMIKELHPLLRIQKSSVIRYKYFMIVVKLIK